MIRLISIAILVAAAAALVALSLLPSRAPEAELRFGAVAFADLEGWRSDDHGAALGAFVVSCRKLATLPETRPMGAGLGRVGDWLDACRTAKGVEAARARQFFENEFRPFAVSARRREKGLFTGYYVPELDARRAPTERFNVPIYRRPPELVTVDLGRFRRDLAGRRIAGEVRDGRLAPFATRRDIEVGALAGRGLELYWAADPVAVFDLHIQGSGRLRLGDGSLVRVGYDGPNGHPYTSVGRLLVARGVMTLEQVSAPAIWRWMRENPAAARDLMQENASYVFFRELPGAGVFGAQGVALTPGRSLAVDRTKIALGAPVWLETTQPDPADPAGARLPFRRLMVAQDTGGAIRGAVRGDVFWGAGHDAALIAGHMREEGRYFVLLPAALAAALAEAGR